MRNIPSCPRTLVAAVLAAFAAAASASGAPGMLRVDVPSGAQTATIRIALPDGTVRERALGNVRGQIEVDPYFLVGGALADGSYGYEVVFSPAVPAALARQASERREAGDTAMLAGWPAALSPKSGSFGIDHGQLVDPSRVESATHAGRTAPGTTSQLGPVHVLDQVIADDLIVQGSICAGFDCVNNESFGFDTLRLKENNLRINFDDTSTGAGFPATDWTLSANDSASGGLNRFSIENITASTVPFTFLAAPTNTLYAGTNGKIGFRTSTPVLDLHMSTSDTPAIRFEQTNAGGFTAQTWDIGANEANFFVRDVTGGSRLSLRIRPGAPTSSIDVAASGRVGMGTASPTALLHVNGNAALVNGSTPAENLFVLSNTNPALSKAVRLTVDATGNMTIGGVLTQSSSRTTKTAIEPIGANDILAKLARLPLATWIYNDAVERDRHIGPMAEDFFATFGLGRDARTLAPSDVAGVALAAAQALQGEVARRDRRIEQLEARLARLESMLGEASAAR